MSEELAEIKEKLERIEKYLGEDFKKKLELEEKEKNKKEEKEVEEFYTPIIDFFFQRSIKYNVFSLVLYYFISPLPNTFF